MSRWGISSLFWPSMASQASRERSRAPAAYRAYNSSGSRHGHRSAAPSPATYRLKTNDAEYGTRGYDRDHEYRTSRHRRHVDDTKHHPHHSYSYNSYDNGRTDYAAATTPVRASHTRSSSSTAYPAYYYGTTKTSPPSSSASASSTSSTGATTGPHRRRRGDTTDHHHHHHHHDEERVSTIPAVCYGGGDSKGHSFRAYSSYEQYRSEKMANAKKPKKHVHWADEQPQKQQTQTQKQQQQQKQSQPQSQSRSRSHRRDDTKVRTPSATAFHYNDGYYYGHTVSPAAMTSKDVPSSKRSRAHHRYSYYDEYDDEVSRRARKSKSDYYRQSW